MNLKRNNDSEKELSQQDIDDPKNLKKNQKKLGNLMNKQSNPDDFEESVEDLNELSKPTGIKSEKEYKDIWDAIHVNDTTKLEKLLGGKEWPTSALFDKDGNHTMLHTAAALGHVESLMVIIEHTGAKPDLLNSNLATPLHFACRNNHDMVAKFLINSGVDINIQDEHGQTCLLICCIHGHKKLAQILIESSIAGNTPEPLDMDLKDNRGLTPLNCVTIKGDLNFVKFLIDKGGAKIDEASPKGCNALLYAARGGYPEVVKYLLEKGANSLHQDNSGGTVTHHAVEKGKPEIIETLIEYSVDIDISDNAGRTPLFEAIDNNRVAICRLLVQNGARVNLSDYSGHTPLYCAARDGNDEILKILIDIGKAKVDHYGKCSNPKDLDDDIEYENEDEKLIIQGLDASKTPLNVASLLGYKEIVSYLVKDGNADPDILGDNGFNSLHFSVIGKQPEITQYLITNSHVDFNAKSKEGKTVRELIEEFMPMYLEHYDNLIESLPIQRLSGASEGDVGKVATHYYTPEDDRAITGVQDQEEVNKIYAEAKGDEQKEDKNKKLMDYEEADIHTEEGKEPDTIIERVFGMKCALGLISTSWKLREEALKHIHKNSVVKLESDMEFMDTIKACCTACNIGIQDKVMKVFNAAMAVFSFLVSSSKLEEKGLDVFVRLVTELEI